MIGSLIAKFLKGRWGSVLPTLLKAVAEGKAGEPAKAVYWKVAGFKTVTGAALGGIGAGLTFVCTSYGATYPWACTASGWVMGAGALLFGVGLIDGGTRSPWPDGTPKE